MKFCEVSRNSISNRHWKFQLSILKSKKVLFLIKYYLRHIAKIDPKDGISCPNFQWRFWCRDPVCGKKHLTSAAVIFTWPFQIIDTHQPPPVFSAKIAFKNHMNFIQITSRIIRCDNYFMATSCTYGKTEKNTPPVSIW